MTEAVKFDQDKNRLDLLPFDALEDVAKVFTYGAKKYGERNWEHGFSYGRNIGAALRHFFAFADGEDLDPETGLSHLSHAICNLLFLRAFQLRNIGVDNRRAAK